MSHNIPTPEDIRRISLDHFGDDIDTTDEELQADIDEFFDMDAAAEYERRYPEEVAASRRFLANAVLGVRLESVAWMN